MHRVVVWALILTIASRSWGERQPAPKIDVLPPKAGPALGGLVDVRREWP